MKVELASKAVTLLTSRVDDADALAPGTAIHYANDPDIAPDGKVYFSDSAHGLWPVRNRFGFYDTMQAYMLSMFQARPAGCRLGALVVVLLRVLGCSACARQRGCIPTNACSSGANASVQGRPTKRVMCYDPADRSTCVVAESA